MWRSHPRSSEVPHGVLDWAGVEMGPGLEPRGRTGSLQLLWAGRTLFRGPRLPLIQPLISVTWGPVASLASALGIRGRGLVYVPRVLGLDLSLGSESLAVPAEGGPKAWGMTGPLRTCVWAARAQHVVLVHL